MQAIDQSRFRQATSAKVGKLDFLQSEIFTLGPSFGKLHSDGFAFVFLLTPYDLSSFKHIIWSASCICFYNQYCYLSILLLKSNSSKNPSPQMLSYHSCTYVSCPINPHDNISSCLWFKLMSFVFEHVLVINCQIPLLPLFYSFSSSAGLSSPQ